MRSGVQKPKPKFYEEGEEIARWHDKIRYIMVSSDGSMTVSYISDAKAKHRQKSRRPIPQQLTPGMRLSGRILY